MSGNAGAAGWPAKTALFGAFCFFLSTIEYMIPKPLPFMRLGLAMAPILLASDFFPFRYCVLLAAVKISGQALITGTLFSYIFLFSAAGTMLSTLAMYGLRRVCGSRTGFAGRGAAGAMVSNGAQLFLARHFVFGNAARFVAPPFLAAGLVTGVALGFFCEYFSRASRWYGKTAGGSSVTDSAGIGDTIPGDTIPGEIPQPLPPSPPKKAPGFFEKTVSPEMHALAGLVMAAALLLCPGTAMRCVQFLYFALLLRFSGKRNNYLFTAITVLGIVAVNLLVPYGKVLVSLGPLKITQGALKAGIHRAVTLEALIMLSRFCIRPNLALPGFAGGLLSESFRIFSAIRGRGKSLDIKNITPGLDALLFEFDGISGADTERRAAQKTAGKGYAATAAMAAAAWIPFFLSK